MSPPRAQSLASGYAANAQVDRSLRAHLPREILVGMLRLHDWIRYEAGFSCPLPPRDRHDALRGGAGGQGEREHGPERLEGQGKVEPGLGEETGRRGDEAAGVARVLGVLAGRIAAHVCGGLVPEVYAGCERAVREELGTAPSERL